ncbi:hypothetical protein BN1097_630262 [Clostridioides difficile]|uniref:Uncharacterized protein n=1 Tax=Clostridioides difficile TaxID=1496 RepID=A0A069AAU9_CLODI|nr:hypothetical protein BN1097_630262 [Clostridioides difficile]
MQTIPLFVIKNFGIIDYKVFTFSSHISNIFIKKLILLNFINYLSLDIIVYKTNHISH